MDHLLQQLHMHSHFASFGGPKGFPSPLASSDPYLYRFAEDNSTTPPSKSTTISSPPSSSTRKGGNNLYSGIAIPTPLPPASSLMKGLLDRLQPSPTAVTSLPSPSSSTSPPSSSRNNGYQAGSTHHQLATYHYGGGSSATPFNFPATSPSSSFHIPGYAPPPPPIAKRSEPFHSTIPNHDLLPRRPLAPTPTSINSNNALNTTHATTATYQSKNPGLVNVSEPNGKQTTTADKKRKDEAKIQARVEQLLYEYSLQQSQNEEDSGGVDDSSDSGNDDFDDEEEEEEEKEDDHYDKQERISIGSLLNPEQDVPFDRRSAMQRTTNDHLNNNTQPRNKMDILNFIARESEQQLQESVPPTRTAPSPVTSPSLNNHSEDSAASIVSQLAKLSRTISSNQGTSPIPSPTSPRPSRDHSSAQSSKKRKRASPQQVALLENIFAIDPLPNTATKHRISQQLGMTPRRVTIWFQNKRARLKKTGGKEKPKKDPFTFHHLGLARDGRLTLSSDGSAPIDIKPTLQRIPRRKRARVSQD